MYVTETTPWNLSGAPPGSLTMRMYVAPVADARVPLPDRLFDQLRAGTPVGQNPPGDAHVVAGHKFTSAAADAVQLSVIVPEPPVGPGTTQLCGAPGERLGSSGRICVVVDGPVDKKNNVRTNPAPRTASKMPMATSPVRTRRRRRVPAIDLRDLSSHARTR